MALQLLLHCFKFKQFKGKIKVRERTTTKWPVAQLLYTEAIKVIGCHFNIFRQCDYEEGQWKRKGVRPVPKCAFHHCTTPKVLQCGSSALFLTTI